MSIQPDKPYPILKHLEDKGARSFRHKANRAAEIPADDPRRAAAREAILAELTDVALITALEIEDGKRGREQAAAAREAERQAAVKAAHELWKGASVGTLANDMAFFNDTGLGAVKAVGDGGHRGTPPEKVAEVLRAGGAVAGLAMNKGNVVVCVPETSAAAFIKQHGVPRTLQWVSGGVACFVLREHDARPINSVKGEQCQVVAYLPTLAGVGLFAPLTDAKWVTPPKSALPADSGELPQLPAGLADMLDGVSGASVVVVDRILL